MDGVVTESWLTSECRRDYTDGMLKSRDLINQMECEKCSVDGGSSNRELIDQMECRRDYTDGISKS